MKIQLKQPNLLIFESELFRTTSTLIIEEDYLLLVDPNWLPSEIDYIFNVINNIKNDKKTYLLFTHSDYDHIIGYGKFKAFETIASHHFVHNENKATQLKEIEKFDDQYYIKRDYNIEYPRIDIIIKKEGQRMQLGGDDYQFYHARGHNADGILTHNLTKGILIVGDYLSNIEFPYLYFSFEGYKATLNKLERLIKGGQVKILITGHGDFTTERSEMLHRIEASWNYIKALEYSVVNKVAFDKKALYERYDFPIIMDKFHQGNVDLLKRELG